MRTTLETVFNQKGRQVWSVTPGTTVHEAIQMMTEKRVEALLVLAHGRLAGILTERDCARRVTLDGKDPRSVCASDVMTSPVVFVTKAHTVGDCLAILSKGGFAHLPVLDGDQVDGVVSMGDLVNSIVREQDQALSHLEGYITGRYPA